MGIQQYTGAECAIDTSLPYTHLEQHNVAIAVSSMGGILNSIKCIVLDATAGSREA